MATGSKFNITITALDKATGVINKINKKMAEANAPVKKFGQSIKDFNKESGITRMVKGLDETGKAAEKVATSVAHIIAPLASVFGAGSIGAVAAMATHMADAAHKILLTGKYTNMTTQEIVGMQGAARMLGIETDTTSQSIQGFGQMMQNAFYGRDNDAQAWFSQIGLDIGMSAKKVRSEGAVLLDFADKMKALDATDHFAAMFAINKAGLSGIAPMLLKGRDVMKQLMDDQAKYGFRPTDDQVNAGEKFFMSKSRAREAIIGLSDSIGQKLIPVLMPLLDQFSDWIAKNRELIGTKVTQFVKDLADALKSVDWIGTIHAIGATFRAINSAITHTIGWKHAIEGLLILMNFRLIVSLAKMGKGIITLAWSIGSILAPVLVTAIRLFGELAIAMFANPVGLWILGAVALGAALGYAARLAINHWKEFEAYMTRMWDNIVAHAHRATQALNHLNPFSSSGRQDAIPGLKYDGKGDATGSVGSGFAIGMGPYQPGGATPAGSSGDNNDGSVDVNINFTGKPDNVKTSTQKAGRVNVTMTHNQAMLAGI